jgi:hypothetical protein
MSELSQGKTDKLPEYSQEHIRLTGDLDFQNFQDELELGGYGRDMYNYNRETLEFTLNPNYNELPINTNVENLLLHTLLGNYKNKDRNIYIIL